MEAVGFIGTGLLGGPMAARLAASDRRVVAWNRTRAKAERLRAVGVRVCDGPAEVFEAADTVILMLSDAPAVEEVLFRMVGNARLRGKTVIQMGTIEPGESAAFRERLAGLGARYIEAPVMGSIPQAEAGELIGMVGCEPEELDAVRPLLEVFGPVHRIGPVGAAATLKLALNHLIAAHATAIAGSLALVRRAGLDADVFMDILRRTNLYAPMYDKKTPLMRARQYANPHFPTRHLLKDARLFRDAAARAGVHVRAVEGILALLQEAVESGLGDLDYASVHEVVDPAGPSE